MSQFRMNRVGEQIKKEMSRILQKEMKDPRVGFVTVTDVDVTGDLQQAKVFVSVYGDEEQKKETLNVLTKASGFLRSEIGNRVKLRRTPELIFELDHSIEYGNRIESILRDLDQEKGD